MDVSEAFQKVTEHPWLLAGAVVVGFFILRPSTPRPPSGGFDPSATLASQEIASRTNVALAEIGLGTAGINAGVNEAAINHMTAVSLGAQQVAMADREASLARQIADIGATAAIVDTASNLQAGMAQIFAGHKEAMRGFEIDSQALNNERALGSQQIQAGLTQAIHTNDTNRMITDIMQRFGFKNKELDASRDIQINDRNNRTQLALADLSFRQNRELANLDAATNLMLQDRALVHETDLEKLFLLNLGPLAQFETAGLQIQTEAAKRLAKIQAKAEKSRNLFGFLGKGLDIGASFIPR